MRTIAIALLLASCAPPSAPQLSDHVRATLLALEDDDTPDPTLRVVPDGVREQVNQTVDCPDGGSVYVQIRRDRTPEPFARNGHIMWTYTECGTWDHGTINGTASFSRSVSGGPPWERTLRYNADLTFKDGSTCNAYVHLAQSWATADLRLQLPSTCPHPVEEWWGMVEL